MSVQIALGAPATRVASRKLGPVAGSRSPPAASVAAAWATSTLASTCGRCETAASIAVVGLGVDRRRAAPRARAAAGAGARRGPPRSRAAGVRYQVAPSNRSARACSTPAVSAPASGWPPTNRGSSMRGDDRALGRADVGDHAVAPARRPAPAPTELGQRADRRGDEHRLGVGDAPRQAAPRRGRSRRARSAASQRLAAAVVAGHRRRRAARARRAPTEPPISPTPMTAIRIASRGARRGRGARRTRVGQAVEHLDGRPPSRGSRR